ncbi:MAG: ABC transporter permease, partial [Victivallales bacterium]|nr:ABC transporter permease [Victivallales bacterium]
ICIPSQQGILIGNSMDRKIEMSIESLGAVFQNLLDELRDAVVFTGELVSLILQGIRKPSRIRWRETLYYMDMCGSDAVPIVMLICLLMGIILGFQGAIQLQQYGGDVFIADFVALVITKELGPLMVAMICTGRAGSAFAAEIGTMKVGEEIDALRTMGLEPGRFLTLPKFIAMVVAMPLLTVFGDIIGIIGGLLIAVFKMDLPVIIYYNRVAAILTPLSFILGLFKSLVFAIIITAVGCRRGFRAKSDAQGVGHAATSSVVSSIFWIVIADFVLTFIYSFIGE